MSKLQRFNPWPIFLYNSRLIREDGERGLNWPERALLYGAPSVGLLMFIVFKWQLMGVPQLLAATALLAGSMISVFVFLANLRVKIQETEEYRVRYGLKELVATSAFGALHASVVAMALGLLLALMASIPELSNDSLAANIFSGLSIWLLLHLVISLGSVLRRLLGIYDDLFSGDILAKPEPE